MPFGVKAYPTHSMMHENISIDGGQIGQGREAADPWLVGGLGVMYS